MNFYIQQRQMELQMAQMDTRMDRFTFKIIDTPMNRHTSDNVSYILSKYSNKKKVLIK